MRHLLRHRRIRCVLIGTCPSETAWPGDTDRRADRRGNLRGINGGAFFFLHLPHTGIEVDLPLIAYWPMTAQPDAGVTPDIVVERHPSDLAADRQMARAIAILTG